ncbi:GH25 family lysozyme [Streptomyces sp. NPDC007025]|uniref:GH25 family lysozyme n=1 Tax=Streptomyces sp. NPDC007025 TaxID=3364771 RepID=UPI00367822E1
MIKGIDVASYQSRTPSLSGMDFVFVKATEGTSYVNPKMRDQAAHARKHGRVVGFYHFVRPGSMSAQARYFVDRAASLHGDPLVLDWEVSGVSGADKDRFIREVQRLRGETHQVGLYCSQNYWLTRDTTSFAGDFLWVANYNGRPGHPGVRAKWTIHQYTSSPLDTNVADFSSRADMLRWANKGADSPSTPDREPKWLPVSGRMPELRYGDESWYVNWLQRNLNRFLSPNIPVTGRYDAVTARAVDKFYADVLSYDTKTGGKIFGADGWRRVLSISEDKEG